MPTCTHRGVQMVQMCASPAHVTCTFAFRACDFFSVYTKFLILPGKRRRILFGEGSTLLEISCTLTWPFIYTHHKSKFLIEWQLISLFMCWPFTNKIRDKPDTQWLVSKIIIRLTMVKQVFIFQFIQISHINSESRITDADLFSYVIKGIMLTYHYCCDMLFESNVDRVTGGD